jgi:excisionase family DNA binding protein
VPRLRYDSKQEKMSKEFFTAKEIAEKFSLNVMTIYRYINAKKLTAHKIGKEYRITDSELNAFLERTKKK